jgi:hypothetical protein
MQPLRKSKLDKPANTLYFYTMNDNFITEYFGIGIQNGKTPENLGVLWRTAQNLELHFLQ